ncbi:N-acetyltransferase [Georhizobium profundi]|uniref:N-acetyltransferase n=1 Tax=Georhizobium profundi TaxID=2341112 RepID=A0A3S9B1Z6_9HYPH|nr:GNAT family N-acetyltransferase [Georhizobium profundi]AZN70959.1 N-acetyltransferase [Georhizobium profundi]
MRLELLRGSAIGPHVADLARLRTTVFRAFPYLYEGSDAYEERYLATYARSADSVFVLAFDGERVVGAATGMPMADETNEVRAPFLDAGWDVDRIFYYGESVLLPDYRGQGIGVRFFEEREAHATGLGRFDWTVFCGVIRPEDHPNRPADYVPLDDFWCRRGYAPLTGLETAFSWRDIGDDAETAKPMRFWGKRIG